MRLANFYISFVDQLNKIFVWIMGLLVGVIFILVVGQVYFRYVMNSSLSWPEEVARYLTIWTVFIGVGVSLRNNDLIAVEVLLERVKGKSLKLITLIISFLFCLFLIFYGTEILFDLANRKSVAAGIPMWVPYLAIPVGGLLTILNIVVVTIELFLTDKEQEVEV